MDKAAYLAVINSKRWRELRLRLLRERGERCERCHKTWAPGFKTSLELHHLTYERLGHERDGDVQLVCKGCHESADIERAKDARERSEHALGVARLNGWASKKYGDNWNECTMDERERIAEEFDEWLEQRDGESDW